MIRKIMALLMGLCTTLLVIGLMPSTAHAADDDNDGIPNLFETSGWWNSESGDTGLGADGKWTYENFPIACNTDSTGPAFQAVIVYEQGTSPSVETNEQKVEFRRFISRVTSIYAASAREVINTDADLKASNSPRWNTFVDSTGKCAPALMREAIPASKFPQGCTIVNGSTVCNASEGDVSATDFFNYMASLGYNRTDRKYIYFNENPYSAGWGGVAQGKNYCDTDKTVTNCSNDGSHLSVEGDPDGVFAWSDPYVLAQRARTTAHEIGHSIGLTGQNSPDRNTSNGMHSRDCWDAMCYSLTANGQPGQVYDGGCGASTNENVVYRFRMDCNRDGQFNAQNPTTGYLANYWNPAKNVFLWGGLTKPATLARPTVQPPVKDDEIVYETEGAESVTGGLDFVDTLRDLLPLV